MAALIDKARVDGQGGGYHKLTSGSTRYLSANSNNMKSPNACLAANSVQSYR